MNKCTICSKEFQSKRKDAHLCSPKCRKLNSQRNSEIEDSVAPIEEVLPVIDALPEIEEEVESPDEVDPATLDVMGRPLKVTKKGKQEKLTPFVFCPKHGVFYSSCHC